MQSTIQTPDGDLTRRKEAARDVLEILDPHPTIPYFFTEKQVHDACSFSKSPMKPELVQRTIQNDPKFRHVSPGIINPIEPSRMKLVHTERYIDGLMKGEIADGFGNKSKKDFQAIRTTVGNFVVAAEYALTDGIVWSLTSGFHHARHNEGGGFCTINALMLSAFELQKYHGVRTLIVDGDAHYGNGCVDILERIPGMKDYCGYFQNYNKKFYRAFLEDAVAQHNPGIIMFQAGADDWVGDPLGGNKTMEELYQRDLITFDVAKRHGIPVVCNLAGGYAENYNNTLRIHRNTGEAMKEVYLGYGIAEITDHGFHVGPDFREEW
jgi:acetoin utilization deacetylase AcuC-like enzyme